MGKELIKMGVVGVGHLGKEHARIYRQLPNAKLIAVSDNNPKQGEKIAEKQQVISYVDYRDIIGKVDAVSIATPTDFHYEICREFLENGVHVLVEKPITKNKREAEKLLALAKKKNLKLQVGHIERFNPVVMDLVERNLTPLYIETNRYSPFRFRSGDIGVVLDLMIHDIDIICTLVQSKVKNIAAVGMNVLGKHEDIANARIEFESGCVANMNASRTSIKGTRTMNLFSSNCYANLDLQAKTGTIYHKRNEIDLIALNFQKFPPTNFSNIPFENYFFEEFLRKEEILVGSHEPLYKELESFVTCILENKEPIVTGEDGLLAISIAEEISEKISRNMNK